MSGGRFNYLYLNSIDELFADIAQIEAMANYLKSEHLVFSADDTLAVVSRILQVHQELHQMVEPLRKVWHAAELHASNDIGKEEFLRRAFDTTVK